MLKDKLTMIINSCEKYSDLWESHILLLNKFWSDRNIETLLVTDRITTKKFENVKVFAAGEGKELPDRLSMIIPLIQTEYVLFTLDDYFLTQKIITDNIHNLICEMDTRSIDYIRLFKRPNSSSKITGSSILFNINLSKNYDVNLYPGIWRTTFLESTIIKGQNAWQYEVSLTKTARDSKALCVMSKGKEFEILDVIRKGKILHKANKYLKKKNLQIGNRQVISYKEEFRIFIFTLGQELLPRFLFRFAKKLLIRFGYSFYSNIED